MNRIWAKNSVLVGLVACSGLSLAAMDAAFGIVESNRAADSIESFVIVKSISGQTLASYMKEAGYAVSVDEDGDVVWTLQEYRTIIFTYQNRGGTSLQFNAFFKGPNTTRDSINNWNRSKRFSSTYLDKDGDPVLQLDLDLDGGVTKQRILDYLRTCSLSFSAWLEEVVE